MLLLFHRHATAQVHGIVADADRALVEKGRDQARRAGRFAARHGLVPQVVLTSPRRRAHETAAIFAAAGGGCEVVVAPWLEMGMAASEALQELEGWVDTPTVGLVGHEPDFSMLVATLLGAPGGSVRVRKASLLGVECVRPRPGGGTLLFSVPSALMK